MYRTPLAALVFALAMSGCSKDPVEVELVAYNAGLAEGFVVGTADRTPKVAAALADLTADVICLQEVWLPDQVAAIKAATSSAFPHSIFPDPLAPPTSSEPACAEGDLNNLLTCAENSCSDVCNDQLVACVFDNCALPFIGLPKSCQGCVQAEVGGTPAEIRETCESQGTSFAYGSSFGTGILSRHPIAANEHRVLDSTTNRRGVIYASIDHPDGAFDVFCTHLTAVFELIPYPRETGSWAGEQALQIEEIGAFINDVSTGAVALLGDLNTGPTATPDNWAKVKALGLDTPYIDDGGDCTYCATNPILARDGSTANDIIDHVLTRGFGDHVSTARVLDGEITTESCGESFTGALSDHYGVSLTTTLPK